MPDPAVPCQQPPLRAAASRRVLDLDPAIPRTPPVRRSAPVLSPAAFLTGIAGLALAACYLAPAAACASDWAFGNASLIARPEVLGEVTPPAADPKEGLQAAPAQPQAAVPEAQQAQAAPAAQQPQAAAPAPPAADSYLHVDTALRDPVGTRLIDIATPFTSGERWLELLVTHRFNQPFNQGATAHNLFGLDSGADVGIGFTYGLLQHLDVSVYRSAFQEDFELAAKYQLFQQAPGMPLSVGVRAGSDLLGRLNVEDPHRPFAQLLLGRRLAPGWNVFVSPTWVRFTPLLTNAWNAPVGITAPLPGHWLLEAEGIAANRALRDVPGASQFAWHVAFAKPIGWHLFQIIIGNSRATTLDQIVGGDFAGGFAERDLRLGFNLLRYFKT
jgi:hypothetical protein